MKSFRIWALGLVAIPLAVMMATIGCTNKINVAPTAPPPAAGTPTFTRTWSLTPVPTNTLTPTYTVTPTWTLTLQYTSTNTLTFTNTITSTDSLTPTDTWSPTDTWTPQSPTDTPTDSLTITPSPTNTSTPTTSLTPTPTKDSSMIDDLEGGMGQINAQPGVTDAGYWYTFGDAGCANSVWPSPTFTPSTPEVTDGSTLCARLTGSGCTVDGGGIGFNFINNGGGAKIAYNITTNLPAVTGVRFMIRATNASTLNTVRFSMASMATEPTASGGSCAVSCSDNFGSNVSVTTAWQSVTLYFQNDFGQEGWGTPAGTIATALTQAFGFQWKFNNKTGAAFGLEVDNIAWVTTPAPPPNCNPIDDMETNNGQIITTPPVCGRNGYWFTFADSDNNAWGQSHCYTGNGTVLSGPGLTFVMSTPGAPPAPAFTGSPSAYAARITGVTGPACTGPLYNTCPFAGMGFNFKDPKAVYDMSAFTGMSFSWKSAYTGAAFRFKIPTVATTPPSDGGNCGGASKCSDDWGKDIIMVNTNWNRTSLILDSTANGGDLSQIGWGTVFPWDKTTTLATQWQYTAASFSFDLAVDDVTFY